MEKELEDMIKMFDEDQRLKSFKKWVFSDDVPCNSAKLAEAGFVYIGNNREPDAVKCFCCGKPLDGWEPEDDPWKEHLKHAPQCIFAKLQTSQKYIIMKELFEIKKEIVYSFVEKLLNDQFEAFMNIAFDN